jgi:hypothetical protein
MNKINVSECSCCKKNFGELKSQPHPFIVGAVCDCCLSNCKYLGKGNWEHNFQGEMSNCNDYFDNYL